MLQPYAANATLPTATSTNSNHCNNVPLEIPQYFEYSVDDGHSHYDDINGNSHVPWVDAVFEGDCEMQIPQSLLYLNDDDDDMHVFDESDSDEGSALSICDASNSDSESLDETASSDLFVQLSSIPTLLEPPQCAQGQTKSSMF